MMDGCLVKVSCDAIPVVNKKTGKTYYLICEALNATNSAEGELSMVVYSDASNCKNVFVRTKTEFEEKFSRDVIVKG
jgi:hypothetical protein